jgi:hypothetical protein
MTAMNGGKPLMAGFTPFGGKRSTRVGRAFRMGSMKRFFNFVPVILLAAGALHGQNSDLGLLVGASDVESTTRDGVVRDNVTGGFQINYAWQLVEGRGGRLYVEVPFQVIANENRVVGPGVVSQTKFNFFLTPGLRYQYNVAPRVGLYVAAGGGLAMKGEERRVVGGGSVVTNVKSTAGGGFNFGGGLDFRLTRLWSLRGELRNFRTTKSATAGLRSVIAQFGIALHF